MNAELQAEFQVIADKGISFSVTLPEVAEVITPAVPAETVEFAPSTNLS